MQWETDICESIKGLKHKALISAAVHIRIEVVYVTGVLG
jgi:hypothetical protein